MIKINSVNWCDTHRIQFPCDKQCPQCVDDLNERLKKILIETSEVLNGGEYKTVITHAILPIVCKTVKT